jgi:hypothetical protein
MPASLTSSCAISTPMTRFGLGSFPRSPLAAKFEILSYIEDGFLPERGRNRFGPSFFHED